MASKNKPKAVKKTVGLRDDLDEIDENDVGEKRRLAFLDLMIETAHYTKKLSMEDIKDQVFSRYFHNIRLRNFLELNTYYENY